MPRNRRSSHREESSLSDEPPAFIDLVVGKLEVFCAKCVPHVEEAIARVRSQSEIQMRDFLANQGTFAEASARIVTAAVKRDAGANDMYVELWNRSLLSGVHKLQEEQVAATRKAIIEARSAVHEQIIDLLESSAAEIVGNSVNVFKRLYDIEWFIKNPVYIAQPARQLLHAFQNPADHMCDEGDVDNALKYRKAVDRIESAAKEAIAAYRV